MGLILLSSTSSSSAQSWFNKKQNTQGTCGFPTITYSVNLTPEDQKTDEKNTQKFQQRSSLFPQFPEWFNDSLVPDVVDLYNDQPTLKSGLGDLFNQIYVGHEWPEKPHEVLTEEDADFLSSDPSTGANARFDPENERPGRLSYGYAPIPEDGEGGVVEGGVEGGNTEFGDADINGRSDVLNAGLNADLPMVDDDDLELPSGFRGKIKPEDIGRIVGGQEAIAHSWPWMAYLNFRNRYHCGGSLISDQFTLTAAHCITRYMPVVVLGLHNTKDLRNTQIIYSDKIIRHPSYNKPKPYDNDVALVRLMKKANFNEYVQPICLGSSNFDVRPGYTCVTTGWGRTNVKLREYPSKLQEVAVKIIDMDVCQKLPRYSKMVTDNMLCAGHLEGGKDACAGDSGGPLVCRLQTDENEKSGSVQPWILTGVVSWGIGCAQKNMPGVYAKTNLFLDFIKQHTAIESNWTPKDMKKFINLGTSRWNPNPKPQSQAAMPAQIVQTTKQPEITTTMSEEEKFNSQFNCGKEEDIQSGRGSLTSPNFPGRYEPNMKCQWKIVASDPSNYLYFRFNTINVDNPRNCMVRDHITILSIDGKILVPALCRAKRGFGITAKGGLIIRFKTDGKAERRGWRGEWKEIPHTRSDVDFEDSEGDDSDDFDEDYPMGRSDVEPYYQQCPMEIPPEYAATSATQVITSPNYPEKYGSDNKCYYVIRAEHDDHKIRLRFTDFKVEQGKSIEYNKKKPDAPTVACLYDAVEIRMTDKLKKTSVSRIVGKSKLIEERCGKARIRVQDHHSEKRAEKLRQRQLDEGWVYETTEAGQSMVIVFRSDHKRVSRGFRAEFSSFE